MYKVLGICQKNYQTEYLLFFVKVRICMDIRGPLTTTRFTYLILKEDTQNAKKRYTWRVRSPATEQMRLKPWQNRTNPPISENNSVPLSWKARHFDLAARKYDLSGTSQNYLNDRFDVFLPSSKFPFDFYLRLSIPTQKWTTLTELRHF